MNPEFTAKELQQEIRRLAPFHHRIELPHGLSTYVPELSRREVEHSRVDTLVAHAFPALTQACGGTLRGKRVLDVACNCGGFSVEAAKLGASSVLGFDSVAHYIEQANLIRQALGLEQIEFKTMDIDEVNAS